MQEDMLLKRTEFIISLLNELKDVQQKLTGISSDIQASSGSYYKNTFEENRDHIQKEMQKFRENNEKIKLLNNDRTLKINTWYDFVKNTEEIKTVAFPLNFYFGKKKIIRELKIINERVLGLAVQNRLIVEQLTIWEHDLELKVMQQIKQGSEYLDYEKLINKKEVLISQIKYLLPTLPDICPIEFYIDNIDDIIEKLSKMAAA